MSLPKRFLSAFAAGALAAGIVFGAAVAETNMQAARAGELLLHVKEHGKDKKCCKACFKKKGQPKVCETFCGKNSDDTCDDFEEGKIKPKPKLEDAPCYPICADQCAKTRGSLTLEACIIDCLNRTRCSP